MIRERCPGFCGLLFAGALVLAEILLQGQFWVQADLPAAHAESPLSTEGEAASLQTSWRSAQLDYAWSFPADHWSHPGYKTEWWYVTGHLLARADTTRQFGYQFTLFRIGLAPEMPALPSQWATGDLVMGHASISDLAQGRHVFSEVLYRAVPLLGGFGVPPDSVIAWSRAPAGTDATWQLTRVLEGFALSVRDDARQMAFSLRVRPTKPLILQGPNGYSRKGHSPSSASQYYSFTRLQTEGTLEVDGETFTVTGQSWMDREFGSNQLDTDQVGWDWFSLQMDDGREIMLYHLRNDQGRVDFGRGVLVDQDGRARPLTPEEWQLQVLERWQSQTTGAEYPVSWQLDLPTEGLRLRITALLAEQENISRHSGGLHYWEGAVQIQSAGTEDTPSLGKGYVELTGYGEGNRPPI